MGWIRPAAFASLTGGLLILAWAYFWPVAECSDPACARVRYRVFAEVDALQTAGDVPFALNAPEEVSAPGVLAPAGVELQIRRDSMDLPYDPAAGPLGRADLDQLLRTYNSLLPPADADAKIYAVLTPPLVADGGEQLFGVMFDHGGREGFAIAPGTIRRRFERLQPDAVGLMALRTFLHEVLHTLNRYHLDAAQMPDGRVTLEAPTKCLADTTREDWRLTESPLMAVSPSTIRHFQSARRIDVLPGPAHTPFDDLRGSADECAMARANQVPWPVTSRWGVAVRRLQGLFGAEARAEAGAPVADTPGGRVLLGIQAMPASYPLGYPVTVRLFAHNGTTGPVPLKGRLMPEFGMVAIEIRPAEGGEWRAFRPHTLFEPAGDGEALLAPGERTEASVPIYFGADGWTFPAPGRYQVRASLAGQEGAPPVITEPIVLGVVAPRTRADRAALRHLTLEVGGLSEDAGRMLTYASGTAGPEATWSSVETLVTQHGHTALGGAMRLMLATHLLRPTLDAATGRRPEPDAAAAEVLLAEACTDSGIAGARWQVVQQYGTLLSKTEQRRLRTPVTAPWDGTGPDREPVETYASTDLAPAGPSLHFCFADDRLRGAALRDSRTLARALRDAGATRVVLAGHADQRGSCEFNDALAMRRAAAVKRVLVNAGIPGRRLQVASLGERRPRSFSTSPRAWALNRRVEVLIDKAARDSAPALAADGSIAVPACTGRLADPG